MLSWPIAPEKQGPALAQGLRALGARRRPRAHPWALPEQPLDRELLALSRLYRRSRELYLQAGGKFRATLVTSSRTLSSPILVENWIEYSPTERELFWSVTDPVARKDPKALERLRTYSASVFHEQNHRVLWKHLPPPPPPAKRAELRRFQNFSESLVIATDMALGDELGTRVAPLYYLAGVVYDPGTSIRALKLSRRQYRNYLHAVTLGTYLTLELYSDETIHRVLRHQFPMLGVKLTTRAADRSLRLDHQFIALTNPAWQKRFSRHLSRTLKRPGERPLLISPEPLENPALYVIAEKWFEKLGL